MQRNIRSIIVGIARESNVIVRVKFRHENRNDSNFCFCFSEDSTVELVYVDYGNNEERPISELRPLDLAFTRLPTQAICAALEVDKCR